MGILKELEPQKVFEYFELISNIPRGSGDEKAISDYMVSFAKNLGLEVIQDEVYNIIIKKPATKGYEDAPTVILQGHLDMVCEKNHDINHDFKKDPLALYVDGDLIKARGTTLGADNGIAIAYQMAILASNDLQHPKLEILMTIDEERGMVGVANMHPEYLHGKTLINLDSEREGEFLVSCAGGVRTQIEIPFITKHPSREYNFYELMIKGLKGGHSGTEIHLERANANILMGRLLNALNKEIDLELASLSGGSKDNVITRESVAVIGIHDKDKRALLSVIKQWEKVFKDEFRVQDPGLRIVLGPANHIQKGVFSKQVKDQSIELLMLHPNGVQGVSMDMENLIETSLNLGIVETTANQLVFSSALRSSVPSKKEELVVKIEMLAKLIGGEFSKTADYPAWVYEPDSPIRKLAMSVYKQMYGRTPTINAIHAGLECGFISEKLPGVDIISFGPNIKGAHTPDESLSIESTKNVWEFLKELLKQIGKK